MADLQQSQYLALNLGKEIAWRPRRLTTPGPWSGHIPFAFWLIKACEPRLLVELGTHSGNSFSAFCQAIDAFEIPARAFAIDTWEGDEHAGHYGDEVYKDLKVYLQKEYGNFATMVRSTFDMAAPEFHDASIDVLHIDGMHTYEAVKHDFDTWSGKLSDRAVVVFHDTNVREREFGVWRLWQDLSRQYPSFEFTHSNGLGVLGVGKSLPPMIAALCAIGRDENAARDIRNHFSSHGRLFELETEVLMLQDHIRSTTLNLEELASHAKRLEAANDQLHRELGADREQHAHRLAEREAELNERHSELDLTRHQMAASRQTLEMLTHSLDEANREGARMSHELAEAKQELGNLKQVLDASHHGLVESSRGLDEARREISEFRRQRSDLARAVDEMHRSTSWRITKPIRLVKRVHNRYIQRNVQHILNSLFKKKPTETSKELTAAGSVDGVAQQQPSIIGDPNQSLRVSTRMLMNHRFEAFLNSGAVLDIPSHDDCDVSIILVLYNQSEMTYACLASIKECLGESNLKINTIIFDNASQDRTDILLDRVKGAKIIRNESNLHFLRAVNAASKYARGKYILLLNNDAQLLPGTLERAVETIEKDPSIGAVGGRIILPDGSLQEAGSIIWDDGTCLGYGRGRKPSDPEFMFQRDVDYCSGAFLLTPRALFNDLGGFDEAYAPAYYEETDYCVRIWESGRRIVYNPKATILHFEFASSEKVGDALELQQRNFRVFCKNHRKWLSNQREPGQNIFDARERKADGPRILFMEDRIPKTWLGAGYPRAADIIKQFVDLGAHVTLFPTLFPESDWNEIWKSLPATVEVARIDDSIELDDFLRQRRGYFDAIFVTRPHNMEMLRKVLDKEPQLRGNTKLVYDAEALFANRELLKESLNGKTRSATSRQALIQEELDLTKGSDLILSVSPIEKELMLQNGLKNVEILGHKIEADITTTPFEDRPDIVFLGSVHDDASPNADSIRWFVSDVLPRLRYLLDQPIQLKVVGLVKAPSIQALDGSDLKLIGPVDDLKPTFEKARMVVVPTRFAAGIPHKVHQVTSFGVPVVTTDLIASQLNWTPNEDILASSDPTVFAQHCHELYTRKDIWTKLRANALSKLERDCSPAYFDATIADIIRRIKGNTPKSSGIREVFDAQPSYAGRKTEHDFALAVPFNFPVEEPKHSSVAAVIHIFYPELAEEILSYVENLPLGSDVFISTDTENKRDTIEAVFAGYTRGKVEVRIFPNRGRDIAPKIVGYRDIYSRYAYVLHLHSKKSTHNDKLNNWRTFLYENLLGSSEIVNDVLSVFENCPKVGMIFSQHFEYIRQWITWTDNFDAANTLAGRLGFRIKRDQALDFPSGSMFWARSDALRALIDLNLSFDDFEDENGQEDNTIAHAIERLYAIICELSDYSWLKISRPELLVEKKQLVSVGNWDELNAFIRNHTVHLTSGEILPKSDLFHVIDAPVTPELSRITKRNADLRNTADALTLT